MFFGLVPLTSEKFINGGRHGNEVVAERTLSLSASFSFSRTGASVEAFNQVGKNVMATARF